MSWTSEDAEKILKMGMSGVHPENKVKWQTRSADTGRGYQFGYLLAWVGCPDGAHAVIIDGQGNFVDRRYDQVWPAK